jgi:hypothetical protein
MWAELRTILITVRAVLTQHRELLCRHGLWVYDFALPLLMLHALKFKSAEPLRHWISICPRRQITTLDTHDGM